MPRRVRTTQLHVDGAPPADTYFDKVVKYIPADIVGAWIAVSGLVASAANVPQVRILWIAFFFGLVLTALWTLKQTSEPGKPPAWVQVAISTGAFGVWVAALGPPFNSLGFQPLYGSLLLIAYTLVVALINPK